MPLENLISKAKTKPKKLFLIDGLGALLSAFLLAFVLTKFELVFGIPSPTLYLLSAIPTLFTCFDFYAYRNADQKTALFLKRIAALNVIYCCISLALMFYHFETITTLGWTYILLEILIVMLLAFIEFRVGRKIIQART